MNCHSQRKASFVKKKVGEKEFLLTVRFIMYSTLYVHCMYTLHVAKCMFTTSRV